MDPKIEDYCIEMSKKENELLSNLRRETYLKTISPHMISDPLLGQFLNVMVKSRKPNHILEIGTFTGYSSIWMADALQDESKITTLELNEELSVFHDNYFPQSTNGNKINVVYCDANEFLEKNEERFDLVFMDAGKKDYIKQYELLIPMMNSGDMIIADNVLWKSLVVNEVKDKMTTYMDNFNKHILSDQRVSNLIVPLRDGINMIVKN